MRKTHTFRFVHARAGNTRAHRERPLAWGAPAGTNPQRLPWASEAGPARYQGSALPPEAPPTPNVFPIELKTNMAAFVYFLIGMPASWIMSATAEALRHSLHKQQLEKQDRGHRLGDFP